MIIYISLVGITRQQIFIKERKESMGKFKKRNALRRGFAVVLAMATLVGTLSPGSSLLAEEVPVDTNVEDDVSVPEPEKEDGGGKESDGSDSLVRRLYVSVSDGGSVACRWGAESLLVYREGGRSKSLSKKIDKKPFFLCFFDVSFDRGCVMMDSR